MKNLTNQTLAMLAAFLLVALVVFYWPWLSGAQSYYMEDLTNFFEPLCSFVGQGLRSGHLPLWNPYSYCGMSQAAISSPGIFYPLNWFLIIPNFNVSLSLIMICSQLAAGIGSYLLVRSFGWEKLPALTASITMALGGYMFTLVSNYSLVVSAAWIPFLLYCIRQLCRSTASNTVAWMGGVAATLFMHIAAGRPEISAPGLLLAVAYAAYEVCNVPAAERLNRGLDMVKAFIIGGLLTMPSTLPLIEWTPWSRRSEGLLAPEVLMFSANWFDLLSMVASHPLGDLQMRDSPFRLLVLVRNLGPYYGSAFIGAPVVALAFAGMAKRGGSLYKLGLLALVASILVSLGSTIPGSSEVVEKLPALSVLRFPCKFLFFTVLVGSLFAARGLQLYLCDQLSVRLPLILFALLCGWGLIGLSGVATVFPFYHAHVVNTAVFGEAQRAISNQLIVSSAAGMLTVLILAMCRQKKLLGGALVLALCAVALLLNAFGHYRAGAPANYFNQPSFAAEHIKTLAEASGALKPRTITLFLEGFTVPAKYKSPDMLSNTIGAYQYSRQAIRPFTNLDFHMPSAFGFEGAMVGEYFYLLYNCYLASSQWTRMDLATQTPIKAAPPDDMPLARLLRIAATDFAITQDYRYSAMTRQYTPVPPLDSRWFAPAVRDGDYNVRIFRVNNALPRAYVSYAWRNMDSRDSLIEQISNSKSGFDPGQQTLVEPLSDTPNGGTANQPVVPANITSEPTPEHITIQTKADKRAIVVLADQFYPGWQATVDGARTDILRCNGFFRGVFVEPGEHTIQFNYEPNSVKYGLLLAAVGFLWWLALLLSTKRRTA